MATVNPGAESFPQQYQFTEAVPAVVGDATREEVVDAPFIELINPPVEDDSFADIDEVLNSFDGDLVELETGIPEMPYVPTLGDFPARIGESFSTLWYEGTEKGTRLKHLGAFTVGAVTQAIDRFRGAAFVLPTVFEEIGKYGVNHEWNGWQMGTASGAAIGGLFGVWSYVVGRSFKYSVDAFPETTEKVMENHPYMVGSIAKAVNGFPDQKDVMEAQPIKPEEGYDVDPYQTRKTIPGKAALAAVRGLKTALLFGTTAHVGVSEVNEYSDDSTEKRLRVTAAEAAGTFAVIAAGVTALMVHDSLGLADNIKDVITDKGLLLKASAAFIGAGFVMTYLGRMGERKEAKALRAKIENIMAEKEEYDASNEDLAVA